MVGFNTPNWDNDVPVNQELQQLGQKFKYRKPNKNDTIKSNESVNEKNNEIESKNSKKQKNKDKSITHTQNSKEESDNILNKQTKKKNKRKKSENNDEAKKQTSLQTEETQFDNTSNKNNHKRKHSESFVQNEVEMKTKKKKKSHNKNEKNTSEDGKKEIETTSIGKQHNNKTNNADKNITNSKVKGKNALKKEKKKNKNKPVENNSVQTNKHTVFETANEIEINKSEIKTPTRNIKKNKQVEKLKEMLNSNILPAENSPLKLDNSSKGNKKAPKSLRDKMMERLKGARFRYINEQIYVTDSQNADKYFKEDPDAFAAYHDGYRQQVKKWPLNPLDNIIKDISSLPKEYIIADLGCGDGRLAKSVPQKVHSFDLVSNNPSITACDMSQTPLLTSQVNVVVFCLSLMGTNLKDYIIEANRVLKTGGLMKIAEVESRFENVDDFMKNIKKYGFTVVKSDLNNNLFYFMDFKKESDIKKRNKLPQLTLNPCIYKKR